MRLVLVFVLYCAVSMAQMPDISGNWAATITRYDEPDYTRLSLESKDGHYKGTFWGDVQVDGVYKGETLEFQCSYEEDKQTKPCGSLSGSVSAGKIEVKGKLFDTPATLSAIRDSIVHAAPKTHKFTPTVFHRRFSGDIAPVLHVNPGDTVETQCVDSGGVDEKGEHRSLGGNPLTGPFFIEGALPGDTLVVHLNRVRLNRDTAESGDSVVGRALDPYYFRELKKEEDFDSKWTLDRDAATGSLAKPTERLKNFKVRLQPMLGCVGVAPADRQAFRSGNLGDYGGNMDYSQVREKTTLYLPVSQVGALLFLGDGHAAQGDGELTGDALETSMDVEFTVDLVRGGKSLGQPRAENDEFVMVSGIAGSLNEALQEATTGMSRWLEDEYKLTRGEIGIVLGSSIRYDIAEVVDPKVHIVAKLPKAVLAQIPKP